MLQCVTLSVGSSTLHNLDEEVFSPFWLGNQDIFSPRGHPNTSEVVKPERNLHTIQANTLHTRAIV